MSFPETEGKKRALRLTIFRLLLIGLKAYFDLDRCDGHNLTRLYKHSYTSGCIIITYLVCSADSLCADFRQTDVIKLSLLHQFIEHFGVVLDLIIRVAPRGLEQVELLCAAEGLEDSIDAPAEVLLAPVGI